MHKDEISKIFSDELVFIWKLEHTNVKPTGQTF